ncbi:MAG: cytochrome c maturation protein CcmE [Gemmatimonadetes bacterium]|nr:cytochrome c maturation protein CcmE [Gemmatimonadota bacterium]
MKRFRFSLGAAVIAAGLIYLVVTGFQQSSATHLTLSSLLQEAGRSDLQGRHFQVGGSTVVPGSIDWDEYHSRPEFTITDGQRTLRVRYTGHAVLPDTFRDEAQVVLEGEYDAAGEIFEAQVVFAKCPSKYEGQNYKNHVEAIGSSS